MRHYPSIVSSLICGFKLLSEATRASCDHSLLYGYWHRWHLILSATDAFTKVKVSTATGHCNHNIPSWNLAHRATDRSKTLHAMPTKKSYVSCYNHRCRCLGVTVNLCISFQNAKWIRSASSRYVNGKSCDCLLGSRKQHFGLPNQVASIKDPFPVYEPQTFLYVLRAWTAQMTLSSSQEQEYGEARSSWSALKQSKDTMLCWTTLPHCPFHPERFMCEASLASSSMSKPTQYLSLAKCWSFQGLCISKCQAILSGVHYSGNLIKQEDCLEAEQEVPSAPTTACLQSFMCRALRGGLELCFSRSNQQKQSLELL